MSQPGTFCAARPAVVRANDASPTSIDLDQRDITSIAPANALVEALAARAARPHGSRLLTPRADAPSISRRSPDIPAPLRLARGAARTPRLVVSRAPAGLARSPHGSAGARRGRIALSSSGTLSSCAIVPSA
jgi:hypothetical protein